MHPLTSWLFWWMGSRDGTGAWYGFWSGLGGSLPDIALVAGLCGWYLNHTCHAHPLCLRWGKYEAAGGVFRLCRRHHPDLAGQRPHGELIHQMHRDHQERQQTGSQP